jgi:hypothetical protein
MSHRLTPAEHRVRLQVELAHETHLTLAHEQVDQEDLGAELAVDGSLVSRWCSTKCKDSVGLVDAILANGRWPEVAHRLLRFIGDRTGFDIVPHEGAGPAAVPLADVVVRASTLTVKAVEGEADGIIVPSEASAELEAWNELLRVAVPRRQQLMRILGRMPGDRR